MMISALNNGCTKTGVVNIFVFDIRQKSKSQLFGDLIFCDLSFHIEVKIEKSDL